MGDSAIQQCQEQPPPPRHILVTVTPEGSAIFIDPHLTKRSNTGHGEAA